MKEKEIVRLIAAGAADMMGPAMVMLLAGGVSVIMTNTQTLDTILHAMEQLITGASAGAFAVVTLLVYLRTTFRLAETAEGLYGKLQTNEVYFACLEFAPIALAVLLFAVWHPGRCVGSRMRVTDEEKRRYAPTAF